MGDGIIGKFVYFWMFLLGGLIVGKVFGLTDTTSNVVVLCIALAIIYVGWVLLRASSKKKAAAQRAAEPAPKKNNRHGKKKRK